MSPQATLLWQWQRCGVLDRELRLTGRGEIVACFLGPEGLALAAALEDRRYPLEELIFDCANLFAGDRFAGTNPRRLGRLVTVCERCYHRLTVEGYLVEGLVPQYGYGGSDVVRALVEEGARARNIIEQQESAGRGDVDRLLTEWRSLLRQIAAAPPLEERASVIIRAGDERAAQHRKFLTARWDDFRVVARSQLGEAKAETLPNLPPLTADQRRVINHRFFKAVVMSAVRR